MIYFLRFQQNNLTKYAQRVADLKAKAPERILTDDVRQSLMDVNNAYQMLSYKTKSPLGKFLSFVPFTSAFNLRLVCSERINTAYKTLHSTERKIQELIPRPPVPPIGIVKIPIRRSVSDPNPLPKVYPPVFAKPKQISRDDSYVYLKPGVRLVRN